jgi:hypothetical protein
MTIQEIFVEANEVLGSVVDQIRDDQFGLSLPTSVAPAIPNVGAAINALTYDNAWVPAVLEGKTADEVGDQFNYLKTTNDTRALFAQFVVLADSAAEALDDPEKNVHLSYGDFPAAEYLRHISLYRLLQGYDLAVLTGIPLLLSDAFVSALSEEFGPRIEAYRGFGIFPPEVEVGGGADAQTRLFASFGRE